MPEDRKVIEHAGYAVKTGDLYISSASTEWELHPRITLESIRQCSLFYSIEDATVEATRCGGEVVGVAVVGLNDLEDVEMRMHRDGIWRENNH